MKTVSISMSDERFEKFASKLNRANSPKHFFGNIFIEEGLNVLEKKFFRASNFLEKAIADSSKNEYFKLVLKNKLALLRKWGRREIERGTYNKGLPYYLEITFRVIEGDNSCLVFYLDGCSTKAVFEEIKASWFPKVRADPVHVLRKDKIIFSGSTVIETTQYFFNLTESKIRSISLKNNDLGLQFGDIVKVQICTGYNSVQDFWLFIPDD